MLSFPSSLSVGGVRLVELPPIFNLSHWDAEIENNKNVADIYARELSDYRPSGSTLSRTIFLKIHNHPLHTIYH